MLACGCIFLCGCGDGRPKRVPVSGKVLIDGKPLTYGVVRFVPENARASQGSVNSQGQFTLSCFDNGDGAVLGLHKVAVTGLEHVGDSEIRWHAPKKYQDERTSELSQKIDGPTDSVVIELTWGGGAPFSEPYISPTSPGYK